MLSVSGFIVNIREHAASNRLRKILWGMGWSADFVLECWQFHVVVRCMLVCCLQMTSYWHFSLPKINYFFFDEHVTSQSSTSGVSVEEPLLFKGWTCHLLVEASWPLTISVMTICKIDTWIRLRPILLILLKSATE